MRIHPVVSLLVALPLAGAVAAAQGRRLAAGPFARPPEAAARAPIRRTPLLDLDLAGSPGTQIHLWVADLAPGARTGKHTHPTQRFVYVLEGAVTVEVEGQPARTFQAGEAFQELPALVHDFRNASATGPARALGVQVAATGQPLQGEAPP